MDFNDLGWIAGASGFLTALTAVWLSRSQKRKFDSESNNNLVSAATQAATNLITPLNSAIATQNATIAAQNQKIEEQYATIESMKAQIELMKSEREVERLAAEEREHELETMRSKIAQQDEVIQGQNNRITILEAALVERGIDPEDLDMMT